MFGEDGIVKSHKKRAELLRNIITFSFMIILSRLWYLQVYKGSEFYEYSLRNLLRKEAVLAPRGMMFSRNNELMVNNIPRFDAVVIPQYLKDRERTLKKLAIILETTVPKIKKIMKKNISQARYLPVIIKKNISHREVAIIETESRKMPGVRVVTFISREYKDKEVGGHLLGYISEISQKQLPKYRKRDNYDYRLGDYIGHTGLEEQLDLILRGRDGYQFMQVDALGRMKKSLPTTGLLGEVKNKKSIPGNNIKLSIDRDLQLSAYKALEGKVGSAVAVDVNTGEILSMVSRPGFDPSRFSRTLSKTYWESLVKNDKNPLRDRVIQEHYAPGSTFKVITAIAALEEGIINEKTEVKCPGFFRLGRRKFHCWKRFGHGNVDLIKSLRESCDVYYYKIGTQLDIDVLAKYARMFGLGNKTGIELPRETTGLIPTREWKKKRDGQNWVKGETLSCVIGQSFVLSTPVQLAMLYAAIANKGKLHKPYVVKEIFSNVGEVREKEQVPPPLNIDISKKTWNLIEKGLFQVTNHNKGTAWWWRGKGIQMAGKTGTSQVVSFSADNIFAKCEEREYKLRHHALFAAYAPVKNPQIAVAVVVEHGCHGSSAAAPVARDIITTYMKKYMPKEHSRLMALEKRQKLRNKSI